jgi:hypothetical protein
VFETPMTESIFTATVKGKGKVIRGDGAVAAGLAGKKGALSAKFETKLAEHLKGKVGIEPGETGKPPTAKVGLAGQVWGFPVEEGFQTKVNFVYMKVTLGDLKLPELDLGDAVVTLDLSVEVRVEIGPSKALLARMGVSAGAAGAVTVGVVAVAAVIIGGTIYASEAAKERMLRMVADLAERDGAASQVAYECLGGTERVAVAFREHRLDLTKAGGPSSREGFGSGSTVVTSYLNTLKDQRDAKVALWKEAYAKAANEADFEVVRTRVLAKLAPYENDPQPLGPLIAAL